MQMYSTCRKWWTKEATWFLVDSAQGLTCQGVSCVIPCKGWNMELNRGPKDDLLKQKHGMNSYQRRALRRKNSWGKIRSFGKAAVSLKCWCSYKMTSVTKRPMTCEPTPHVNPHYCLRRCSQAGRARTEEMLSYWWELETHQPLAT